MQTLFFQISDAVSVSISYQEPTLKLWASVRVADLYIPFVRASFAEEKVVNFHFLGYLSSLGYPLLVGPCACVGADVLEHGNAQEKLAHLVAASLKADDSRDAGGRAEDDGDGDGGGDVAAEPQWFFPQQPTRYFYRRFHLPMS